MQFARDLTQGIAACSGVTWRRFCSMLGAWVAVFLAAGMSVAAIDPTHTIDRPMERVSTLLLALPCILAGSMLRPRLAWLVATAGRELAGWRLLTWFVLTAAQVIGATAVAVLADLSWVQMVGVWSLLWAVTVAAAQVGRTAIGGLAPVIVVIAFSVPVTLLPWAWNLVYNADLLPVLWALSAVITLAGLAVYCVRRS